MGGLSKRVVGLGEVRVDQIGIAPRSVDPVVELQAFSIQGGGTIGTALATTAAFGAPTAYFGRVSDDEFGQIILRSLKDFGVDVSTVLIEPGKISPVAFVMVDERTGRTWVRFTRGSVKAVEATELPPNLLDGAGLLLLDGQNPGVQIAAAERAAAAGIPVVLDARHLGPGMGELLDLCDVVIGSEFFGAEIAHSSDIKRSLTELTAMGPRIAVLTLGEEGAIGLEGEKLVRQPALPIEVRDTTGAGEVFRGAFAYAVLHQWPLEKALPFANAAAGMNCCHLGGFGGIPALNAVLRAAGLES